MPNLAQHISNTPSNTSIKVDFKLSDKFIIINFEVSTKDLNTNNKFCSTSYENWGLWETDVVEVFLTRSINKQPYLELQLSPLQQKFALIVVSAREKYHYPDFIKTNFKSVVDNDSWRSSFRVPYSDIPGDSNEVYGNFHAILGKKTQRNYYGLNINPEDHADFHRPDLFLNLGEIPC